MRLCALLVIAACSPYDPSLSDTPFFCGSGDPQCPDGYHCVVPAAGSAVCAMSAGGSGSGSGSGACAMAFAGTLATWDMSGALGSQPSSAATSTASGVVATPIMRSATLMPTQGTSSISSSNWPTSSQRDPAAYYTLSITPPPGCVIDLVGLTIDVSSSGTGPASAVAATSDSNFVATTPVSTTSPSTVSLSESGSSGLVELRVFGYAASASTGTMRIQNQLSLTGAVH